MRITFLFLALFFSTGIFAQESTPWDKLQIHLSIGQYPASLAVPTFSAIHPGVNAGVKTRWNKNQKHQFIQSANLGFFYHRDLQKAFQLYTEIGYNLKFENGLAVTPLALGGGYVLSVADMESLIWDDATQQYEIEKFPVHHNWMISLGTSLSFETNLILFKNSKTTFFLDYRLQIQGVFVHETVPVIAYAPLRFGIAVPL